LVQAWGDVADGLRIETVHEHHGRANRQQLEMKTADFLTIDELDQVDGGCGIGTDVEHCSPPWHAPAVSWFVLGALVSLRASPMR
jgi:hypothetical protein